MRALLTAGLALLLAACAIYPTWYWRNVPTDQQTYGAGDDDAIKVGDRVLARSKKTRHNYELKVAKLDLDGFWGTASDKKDYKFLYEDLGLLNIETREMHVLTASPFGDSSHGPLPFADRRDERWLAVPADQYNVAAGSDAAIEAGDIVAVRYKGDRQTYTFKVTKLLADGFYGVHDGKNYKLRYDGLGRMDNLKSVARQAWEHFWSI